MGCKSVEISPESIRFNGDITRGSTLRTLENRMLNKVANPIELGSFVAGTAPNPNSGGYRTQSGHVLSQNDEAVGKSGRSNFVNHVLDKSKLARISTAPNRSTTETGGKVGPKSSQNAYQLLDTALIIGGKCGLSNGFR